MIWRKRFFSCESHRRKAKRKPGNEKAESETFFDFSFGGFQLFSGAEHKVLKMFLA